jgi:hypothetical protein
MYIYDRPLTDKCTISQSDANTCVCNMYTHDGWAIFNSNTQKDDVTLRVYIYVGTHIILYHFSFPYTSCIAVPKSYTFRGLRFEATRRAT